MFKYVGSKIFLSLLCAATLSACKGGKSSNFESAVPGNSKPSDPGPAPAPQDPTPSEPTPIVSPTAPPTATATASPSATPTATPTPLPIIVINKMPASVNDNSHSISGTCEPGAALEICEKESITGGEVWNLYCTNSPSDFKTQSSCDSNGQFTFKPEDHNGYHIYDLVVRYSGLPSSGVNGTKSQTGFYTFNDNSSLSVDVDSITVTSSTQLPIGFTGKCAPNSTSLGLSYMSTNGVNVNSLPQLPVIACNNGFWTFSPDVKSIGNISNLIFTLTQNVAGNSANIVNFTLTIQIPDANISISDSLTLNQTPFGTYTDGDNYSFAPVVQGALVSKTFFIKNTSATEPIFNFSQTIGMTDTTCGLLSKITDTARSSCSTTLLPGQTCKVEIQLQSMTTTGTTAYCNNSVDFKIENYFGVQTPNHIILNTTVSPNFNLQRVSTLAGGPSSIGNSDYIDPSNKRKFNKPKDFLFYTNSNHDYLIIADTGNNQVRIIDAKANSTVNQEVAKLDVNKPTAIYAAKTSGLDYLFISEGTIDKSGKYLTKAYTIANSSGILSLTHVGDISTNQMISHLTGKGGTSQFLTNNNQSTISFYGSQISFPFASPSSEVDTISVVVKTDLPGGFVSSPVITRSNVVSNSNKIVLSLNYLVTTDEVAVTFESIKGLYVYNSTLSNLNYQSDTSGDSCSGFNFSSISSMDSFDASGGHIFMTDPSLSKIYQLTRTKTTSCNLGPSPYYGSPISTSLSITDTTQLANFKRDIHEPTIIKKINDNNIGVLDYEDSTVKYLSISGSFSVVSNSSYLPDYLGLNLSTNKGFLPNFTALNLPTFNNPNALVRKSILVNGSNIELIFVADTLNKAIRLYSPSIPNFSTGYIATQSIDGFPTSMAISGSDLYTLEYDSAPKFVYGNNILTGKQNANIKKYRLTVSYATTGLTPNVAFIKLENPVIIMTNNTFISADGQTITWAEPNKMRQPQSIFVEGKTLFVSGAEQILKIDLSSNNFNFATFKDFGAGSGIMIESVFATGSYFYYAASKHSFLFSVTDSYLTQIDLNSGLTNELRTVSTLGFQDSSGGNPLTQVISSLGFDGKKLYFADPDNSIVRYLDIATFAITSITNPVYNSGALNTLQFLNNQQDIDGPIQCLAVLGKSCTPATASTPKGVLYVPGMGIVFTNESSLRLISN